MIDSLSSSADRPPFDAPWQAQAFAMTVRLHEVGCFTWPEWSQALSAQIHAPEPGGDSGGRYYECWLAALEVLLAEKGIVGADDRALRKDAWEAAVRATPHGEPILLAAAAQPGQN